MNERIMPAKSGNEAKTAMKGLPVVISGPSGSGKSTIVGRLLSINKDIKRSVSATTRKPRFNETEGINYFFRTEEEFKRMIANNEILEWDLFCGNYYGTPASYVDSCIEEGSDIIFEITVSGARSIKEKYPGSVLIFLLPPSVKELERRIKARGTESAEIIGERLKKAREELGQTGYFDYAVINDTIDGTVDRINVIISAEKMRVGRNAHKISRIINGG